MANSIVQTPRAERDTGVYCIRNTINGKRYVGSSAESIRGRWSDHLVYLRIGKHYNRHLQRAWNKYGEEAFEFVILEECVPAICVVREQHWIDLYKSAERGHGYNICPQASSRLGTTHTEEARVKIAAANRARSPESRAKQAAKMRGRKATEETKAKRSASLKVAYASGRAPRFRHNAEARAKISATQKGRKRSDEFREKLRKARTGWKFSAETRAKMRESAKRRGISPEQRVKMQAARKERHGF